MGQAPFIAVEGPIGVGKSSLAKAISNHFGYYFLQEIVDENPFLHKFYEDIGEWSFQTEMFFLCNRYKQLEDTERDYLKSGKAVVADYHIFKNMIFAQATLNHEQYIKYVQIFDILTKGQANPNLIIYLSADLDTLKGRIKKRGRDFEKSIDPHYLEQLSADYEAYMNEYERKHPHIPILRFDGGKLDFVANGHDLNVIFEAIQETL